MEHEGLDKILRAMNMGDRVFLLKIGADSCPNEIRAPRRIGEWTGGTFHGETPSRYRHQSKNDIESPRDGELALIWVHEKYRGHGLTAVVTMSEVSCEKQELRFVAIEGHLLGPPYIGLNGMKEPKGIFEGLNENRHKKTCLLDKDDLEIILAEANLKKQEFEARKQEIEASKREKFSPVGKQPQSQSDLNIRKSTTGLRSLSAENDTPDVKASDEEIVSENANPWVTPETLINAEEKIQNEGEFDLENFRDAREKILTRIVVRRGQSAFRISLIKAYRGCCAISGCDVPEALEAAHIHPYKGDQTNVVSNGLLLRADLHTLFDQNLIAISPTNMTVVIATKLADSIYQDFSGQLISLPDVPEENPSRDALRQHLSQSGLA